MPARPPVAIVTGASKGVGLAVTEILLNKFNANVITLSRTITAGLRDLASDRLLALECDVANESALTDSIKKGIERYHHIDALILNAGIVDPLCRIGDETPLSEWKNLFDVNFFSLITAVKASLPTLRESELGGRIVFVSSGAAIKGTPGWGPYNTSKAAMNSLCRTLAEEEPGVTSIALRPGVVDTQMQETLREGGAAAMGPGRQLFVDLHKNGKLLKPELPGHIIAALALQCPQSLSGQFVSWDDEACKDFRLP